MQHASTLENSSFNVVLLKYLWRMTLELGHSTSICLTIKWHLQWSQMGKWCNLLSAEDTSESFDCDRFLDEWRHNDVCGLFLPSTGLIENSLFVGVLSHESCHSFMHSLDICVKKLSGGILPWVMTAQIPSLAALSAISFPFITTWLGIQHRLQHCQHLLRPTCLPNLKSLSLPTAKISKAIQNINKLAPYGTDGWLVTSDISTKLKVTWHKTRTRIGSYCIPSCITHRPLPTCQISLKSKKLFVVRQTYVHKDGRTFETHFIR